MSRSPEGALSGEDDCSAVASTITAFGIAPGAVGRSRLCDDGASAAVSGADAKGPRAGLKTQVRSSSSFSVSDSSEVEEREEDEEEDEPAAATVSAATAVLCVSAALR